MIDHPARARVAEIIVARTRGTGKEHTRGSGYLVSPGWVLTACHVVADAVSIGAWLGVPPQLVSQAGATVDVGRVLMVPGADLALLPVGSRAGDPLCEPALFGRLDREPGPPEPVAAAGCPRFKLRPDPARPGVLLRDLDYAVGSIAALSDAKTGRFAFAVDAAPGPDPEPDIHSPWEGMSGAAVWASGRLIGVVGQHHPQEGLASLTVCPVEQLFGPASEGQLGAWRTALPHLPASAENLWLATPPTARKIQVARARRAAEASAPRVLIGRSAELAALKAFTSSEARWHWIQGDAFAGKTALLAEFALHPPERVDVAACFLRRPGDQDTAEHALDVLTRQLELLADGRDYPPPRSVSALRDDFIDLLEQAARACAERGRQLLVLLDGLDEYDPATGGLDLADWLPDHRTLPDQAMLLAASRAGADVRLPPAHPLFSFVQRITASDAATEIEHAARAELDRAARARGELTLPLLCCLAVAGSGLTASELRALLKRRGRDADISEIEAELSGSLSRSLMRLSPPEGTGALVWAFAHDTLLTEARSRFASDLTTYEDLLDAWASDYAHDSWPSDTPQYLMAPYTRELARRARDPAPPSTRGAKAMGGALDRLSALARSPARHAFLLRATGSDSAAYTEIRNAQDLAVLQDAPDLRALIELRAFRDTLSSRNAAIPIILPAVWALLGRFERAGALARSITDSRSRNRAFIELVAATAQAGEPDRAEALATTITDSTSQAKALARAAVITGMAGDLERAVRLAGDADALARVITDPSLQSQVLALEAAVINMTGDEDGDREFRLVSEAVALASTIRSPDTRSRVQAELVGVIAMTGNLGYAESFARSIDDPGFRSWALARLAAVIGPAGFGDGDRAARLADEAAAVARSIADSQRRSIKAEVAASITVAAGWSDPAFYADVIDGASDKGEIFAELAVVAARAGDQDRAGRLADEAEALARAIKDRVTQARVLTALAATVIGQAGDRDRAAHLTGEAEALARTISKPGAQAEALAWLAVAAVRAGDRDQAAYLAGEAQVLAHTITEPGAQAEVLAGLAVAAANAGDRDYAVRLGEDISHLALRLNPLEQAALTYMISQPADVYWLEPLAHTGIDPARLELPLAQLSAITSQTGDMDKAEALAQTITNPVTQAWVLADLAGTAAGAGDRDRAARLAADAGALASTITNPDRQAGALARVAAAIGHAGDLDKAEASARTITDAPTQAETLTDLASAASNVGNRDRAARLAADAGALASTITDPDRQTRALAKLATAIGHTGDLNKAEALARTITDARTQAETLADLASMAGDAGDQDRAVRLAYDAEAAARSIARPYDQAQALTKLTAAIGQIGDLDRAETIARTIARPFEQIESLTELAWKAAQAGNLDRAQKLLALALTVGNSNPGRLIKKVSLIFPSIIKDVRDVILEAYQAKAFEPAYSS